MFEKLTDWLPRCPAARNNAPNHATERCGATGRADGAAHTPVPAALDTALFASERRALPPSKAWEVKNSPNQSERSDARQSKRLAGVQSHCSYSMHTLWSTYWFAHAPSLTCNASPPLQTVRSHPGGPCSGKPSRLTLVPASSLPS